MTHVKRLALVALVVAQLLGCSSEESESGGERPFWESPDAWNSTNAVPVDSRVDGANMKVFRNVDYSMPGSEPNGVLFFGVRSADGDQKVEARIGSTGDLNIRLGRERLRRVLSKEKRRELFDQIIEFGTMEWGEFRDRLPAVKTRADRLEAVRQLQIFDHSLSNPPPARRDDWDKVALVVVVAKYDRDNFKRWRIERELVSHRVWFRRNPHSDWPEYRVLSLVEDWVDQQAELARAEADP